MSHESALPYASAHLPGIGGTLKREPAHFQVVELPLYTPCGEGFHVYVELTREGRATPEVAHDLARLFGLRARDIGYAGLKDKLARTTQTFSLPLATADPRDVAERIAGELLLEVHSSRRHGNKLRRGHLAGNQFRVVVADPCTGAAERARAIASELEARGVPNYFGAQRGGDRGRNTQRGHALLAEGSTKARTWAGRLLVSAFQSSLFNTWLADRIGRGWFERLLDGDVAKRTADGALFDVHDAAVEQPRFCAHEIAHTGPIFGARTRFARGEPGELERAVIERSGLAESDFARAGAPGTRRAGVLWIDELSIEPVPSGLAFTFRLPKGSYATAFLREFMKPQDELVLEPD